MTHYLSNLVPSVEEAQPELPTKKLQVSRAEEHNLSLVEVVQQPRRPQ